MDRLRRCQERAQRLGARAVLREGAEFDFETALIWADERRDYGETRFVALGLIGERVHALCYTENEDGIRVISLRKANAREVKRYGRAQTADR